MKRTAKWSVLFLSIAMMTSSMSVYSAGDAVLPSPLEETASIVADDEATLTPELGEEIVEWREEGVRHYYLGDGRYQAVISPTNVIEAGDAGTYASSYNGDIFLDTYITSTNPNAHYGSNTQLVVGENQTVFMKFDLPELPDSAFIESATFHFWHKSTLSTGTMNIKVYMAQFPWDEASLNWQTANSHANLGIDTAWISGTTLNASTTPQHKSIPLTAAVEQWCMGSRYNYGIALKRVGGTNSSAIIMSSEAASQYQPYVVIWYNLDDVPIQNGTYYIRNGEFHNVFLCLNNNDSDPDDNSSTGVTTNDNFSELLNPFDNGNDAKWRFEYLNNGYYKISNITDQTCLAVRSGYENSSGYALVREIFTGNKRQQWKITETSEGRYKIEPRSAEAYTTDWVMAANAIEEEKGHNVIQYANNGTEDKTDEWYIQPMNITPRISFDVAIEYDDLAKGDIADNPTDVAPQLLEQFQDVAFRFLVMYGIELNLTIQDIALNPNIAVDSNCQTIDDRNAYCSNECAPVDQCSTLHHKSASRFVMQGISHEERICRIVGFGLCGTPNVHDRVTGMTIGTLGNKELVVTTQTDGGKNDRLFLSIQHELSHTFGADEHTAADDALYIECVISYFYTNSNDWCKKCYNSINTYVRDRTTPMGG